MSPMRLGSIALLALTASPASADDPPPLVPHFIEETTGSGLDARFEGDWEFMVGGGAATFDCNDDNRPEIAVAGGVEPASFFLNESPRGGALRFTRTETGIELDRVSAIYPLDIDGDRLTDLVLLRVGENVVMRGLGNCRFERANEAWEFDGGDAWSTAFSATWEQGQTWPTLAIGNYIDRAEEAFPWGTCTENWLHRPNEQGTGFGRPLPLAPSYCALSMLFTDWNRSGAPSLRISNDREYYKGGQEQLWRIPPGAEPALYGEADGWKRLRIWGMGIASTDLDADGFPEYFLTSMADSKLQTLASAPTDGESPAPTYADVAFPKGVIAQRPYVGDDTKPSTGWHAEFGDVNNDGLADLFVAKGNVSEMPDFAMEDPNNLLLQRADGTFEESGDRAGVASVKTSRGGALTDFNVDGLLDLVVVNRNDGAEVWRNATMAPGHWISLKAEVPAPNTAAIGGWIEVRAGGKVWTREITSGGGHAGGSLGWLHFGTGDLAAEAARLQLPGGPATDWQPVTPDSFTILTPDRPPRTVNPG